MDPSTSIKMSGLQQPKIEAVEMAHGEGVLDILPLIEIECFELCAFLLAAR